ncbi:SpoIIE family protein phosphatase [Micromonospora endolithica]|uniref:GAF domain-containing protein n=1 Tax=Micromonospora endolithica TaxID=230091 RepID=A0A3A9ZPL3_9ACTN|nr:SpoIIE family protein phosphatase [Micromonospora endolithica]RKN49417.1 GAF domain-containing protein [Micromonospora endolithica]TWJ23612.1 serine phosphatase RsbU (regulator of sigma subunit) [Micromonospora endolithica]
MTDGPRDDVPRCAGADGGTPRPSRELHDPDRLRSLADTGLGAAPDEAFDRFARLVGDLLDVPVALVSLVDTERQFFPGEVGLPQPWAGQRQTPLSHSFCQHVIDMGVPMVLPDARLHPRVRENLAIPDLGVVAYAGMPLTDLDGRVLGSLCAIDSKPRAWTADQLRTLADLAAACSSELRLRIALDGAEQARRRAEESRERLQLLAGLSETLAGTLEVREALRHLGGMMVPLLADWGLVSVIGPDGRPRDVASAHRDPARTADVSRFADLMRTHLGPASITRAVLRTGQPVLSSAGSLAEVARGTVGPEMPELAARLGFASHLTVPITDAGRGRVLGTITLVNGDGRRAFDDGDLITALDIGRRAGQAIGNSWMYGEQRHVAHVLQHSMLPSLPTVDGLDLAARYQPAADRVEVGGDWYDAFRQPNGDLIVAIGDVAGHDIEAAAIMGQLRNLVRGNAYGRPDAVGELMTHLDDVIRGLRIPAAATATLVRLRADGAGGQEVTWCNAGHPPPLLVRAGGTVEVVSARPEPLLGLTRPVRRTTQRAGLAPGDTLLLFTDGLVERRDRTIDEGMAELVDRLTGTDTLALDKLCDTLVGAAHRREDDIALLAVRAG